jgi:hypothetical protein
VPSGIYEVVSHSRKAGAAVLERFGTQAEALVFARRIVDEIEPGPGDTLVSITVADKATGKTLSTFYPDRYEADSLDDDDDG